MTSRWAYDLEGMYYSFSFFGALIGSLLFVDRLHLMITTDDFCYVCNGTRIFCFFTLGCCIITDEIGTGLRCGVRLICEDFPDQLIILEAVARVQWHFLAFPRDQCFFKIDFHPNLLEESSSNDKVAPKRLFVDNAFHSFAFARQ